MKILLYGAKGWIGSMFMSYLQNMQIPVIPGLSRVDNVDAVKEELQSISPTHVVSMIGRTSGVYNNVKYNTIDYLEQPGVLALNINDNLFSPLVLAMLCKERKIHFTYLGTGCIFNYTDISIDRPWFTEQDIPNFFGSSYSIVKGYTDRLFHLFEESALNLRIRMPISNHDNPRNFISKIIRYEKICSIPNSMTVLETFFPIWFQMMAENTTGTFNCTNPGVISHNEILEIYKKYVDPEFTWQNFSLDDQDKILYAKRSNNHLDTSKIEKYNIPGIYTAVTNTMKHWNV